MRAHAALVDRLRAFEADHDAAVDVVVLREGAAERVRVDVSDREIPRRNGRSSLV